jgi:hypothetical protein
MKYLTAKNKIIIVSYDFRKSFVFDTGSCRGLEVLDVTHSADIEKLINMPTTPINTDKSFYKDIIKEKVKLYKEHLTNLENLL